MHCFLEFYSGDPGPFVAGSITGSGWMESAWLFYASGMEQSNIFKPNRPDPPLSLWFLLWHRSSSTLLNINCKLYPQCLMSTNVQQIVTCGLHFILLYYFTLWCSILHVILNLCISHAYMYDCHDLYSILYLCIRHVLFDSCHMSQEASWSNGSSCVLGFPLFDQSTLGVGQ